MHGMFCECQIFFSHQKDQKWAPWKNLSVASPNKKYNFGWDDLFAMFLVFFLKNRPKLPKSDKSHNGKFTFLRPMKRLSQKSIHDSAEKQFPVTKCVKSIHSQRTRSANWSKLGP